MKKIQLYHCVTIERVKSIMKHGLLTNPMDNAIYFTDDPEISLNWILWRESVVKNKDIKSLGLITFEVSINDSDLELSTDHSTFFHDLLGESFRSFSYHKSINPSKLSFEKCYVCKYGYECELLSNNEIYAPATPKLKEQILKEGIKNILKVHPDTGQIMCGLT